MMRYFLAKALVLFALPFATLSLAQEYPARGVRVIVGSAPGGPIDISARVISQKLAESWRQPVTVENRVGASEMLGTEYVSKAAPDGYTLLVVSLNPFTINPAVFKKLSYDPVRGFASVSLITRSPMAIIAAPAAPFGSLRQLIDAAKARPGSISWSTPGLATANHLAGEWLAAEAGIKLFHVPYKGGPAAANAVLSGDVPFGIVSLIQALPLVKTGQLKVLAITTAQRTPLAPDLPTVAELGIRGFDASVAAAVFAPVGTPSSLISRLNADVNAVLRLPEIRERFAALGVDAAGSSPEELDSLISQVRAKSEQVVEYAKIQAQ